jgi:hypothetical protein
MNYKDFLMERRAQRAKGMTFVNLLKAYFRAWRKKPFLLLFSHSILPLAVSLALIRTISTWIIKGVEHVEHWLGDLFSCIEEWETHGRP